MITIYHLIPTAALASAQTQLLTVLTSNGSGGKPLVAVRTHAKLEAPEALHTEHAKFLLQTEF